MTGRERMLETMTGALKAAGGDEAELVVVAGRSALSRCANSVIHQNVTADDALVVARVIRDGRTGRASAHGFSPEACAGALVQAADLARVAPRDPGFPGLPGPRPLPEVGSHVPATAALGPGERATALKRVFDAAARHGLTVAGGFGSSEKELAVVNSRGVAAYAPLTSAAVNLIALGENTSGFGSAMSRNARELDVDAVGETAILKCREGSKPVTVEPGTYEVILEPAAVAELMEWMTFTSFTARSIREKTSALAGKLGERLVGTNVTIYDDATDPAGVPTPFDFEGQPKRRLVILDRGVARGFGTDTGWAARLGCENTSHAVLPGHEGSDPVPMNLFIAPGDAAAAEMPSRVARGLLVTRFHYVNGFLDTRKATMTGMTRDGTFLIEDGKVKGAVGNLRFTQSLVEAFGDVRAISRERKRVPSWWSSTADTGGLTMPAVHFGSFRFTGRTER